MKIEAKYDPGQEVWVVKSDPASTSDYWTNTALSTRIVAISIGGILYGPPYTALHYGVLDNTLAGKVRCAKESDIFLSEAECQAECDRRNKEANNDIKQTQENF